MGLLDIVPGVGEAKTVLGMAVGGVVGYLSGKYSTAKESHPIILFCNQMNK